MDFQNQPVSNMVAVGIVRPDSARLWVHAEQPGSFTVRWWPEQQPTALGERQIEIGKGNESDNTAGVEIPESNGAGASLSPLTRYRFEVVRRADGFVCGNGSFETASSLFQGHCTPGAW